MTVRGCNPDARAGRPLLAPMLAGALAVALGLLIAAAASAAAPVAVDDTLITEEDVPGTVDVLANDSDTDGDTLVIVDWTIGSNGLVSCDTDCEYSPFFNFNGTDSFTYTIDDGSGQTATASVSVTVTPVNDPPEAAPDEIKLLGGSGSVDVLANDTDAESAVLTVTGSTNGAFGTVSCLPAGTCTYTAGPSFAGTDAFTYDVSDGDGATSTGSVSVCGPTSAGPAALANAIAADPGTVAGASYVATPPCGRPNAVATSSLGGFPTNGSSFAILTSGDADLADDPNSSMESGADLGGPNVRGNTDLDVTILKIDLSVPAGRNCLSFDFRFLSEEFDEFVGSAFNDAFIAELDTSNWSTVGSAIFAPNNFAFDPSGDVISVNSSGATSMSPAEAAGTTYDGATPLLAASTPITPGAHSLYLSIFDQRDRIYDSAVFVDSLVLGTTAPGGCEAGATVLTTAKTADDASTVAGGTNGYTITISNASNAAVSLSSIFDVLPAGFTYLPGSTSGATTTDPTINGQTLTWAGPFNVPAGGSVTLDFGVTVSLVPGDYFNDAGGDVATGAVTPTGPTAKITVTPAPTADLSITKTDSADPVTVGQSLTYTLTVANAGPDAAEAVSVSDALPASVALVSATPSQGACMGTTTVTCALGSLALNGSATVAIVVTPLTDADLSNTATVTSTTADPVIVNNTATETTVVNAVPTSADLSITKTDSSDPVTVGQSLTYTLTVANAGPDAAAGVSVSDTLPANVAHVSTTPSQGTCMGTTTITCALGSIALNGSATVAIVVTPTTDVDLTNTATVSATTVDPVSANNTATETTVVNAIPASADLSITKTDSSDPVTVGQSLTYTLTASNAGPDAALGVSVSDTLPPNVALVSATPSQGGPCTGTSTITCPLGTIALNGSATVAIVVTPMTDVDLSNTATVSSTTADPVSANNTATATTVVNAAPTGPVCNGLAATIVGGPGKDDIQGTPGVDVIVDLGGDNYIQTGGGNDHICLGGGSDEVDSGDGNDFVDAGNGKNKIKTGNGSDTVRSGTGDDELDTGDGNDSVTDLGGKNKIFTGNGDDSVSSGSGDDEIETGNGADVVVDAGGHNKVVTGNENDQITTGAGNDEIDGGNGFDTCSPGAGSNKVKDCEG